MCPCESRSCNLHLINRKAKTTDEAHGLRQNKYSLVCFGRLGELCSVEVDYGDLYVHVLVGVGIDPAGCLLACF